MAKYDTTLTKINDLRYCLLHSKYCVSIFHRAPWKIERLDVESPVDCKPVSAVSQPWNAPANKEFFFTFSPHHPE